MWTQWPQTNPMISVPIIPTPHPEFENARGTANNPDPKEALMRFAVDRISLEMVKNAVNNLNKIAMIYTCE